MKRTIDVCVGEAAQPVGTLRYEQQGAREIVSFEYSAAWLADASSFAIAPELRLERGPRFHRRLKDGSAFPGVLADTEPDGWGRRVILRDHAKRRQADLRPGRMAPLAPLNSLDYLLAVDDSSRVGALRLRDEDGVPQRAGDVGHRMTPPFIELAHLLAASHAVERNEETAADLAYLRGRGTSLGGLRPKCTVLDEDGHLAIGKFPSISDDRAVTKGEVLALRLAARAGITAAEARVVMSDGLPVALVRRFDRHAGERVPYVSAATFLGLEAGDQEEHAYTELVDQLRRHGAEPQRDIAELWRRIAFSILITNVDDHLHNHGFLHVAHGQWELAPAFDVNPFPDRQRELKTWISDESGPEARIEPLLALAPYCRIKPDVARAILHEVEAAVATWRELGREIGMTQPELDQFESAFEHAERAIAQREGRPRYSVPYPR